MISASVVGCFVAAALLLGTAERNEYAFYAGAGKESGKTEAETITVIPRFLRPQIQMRTL